MNCERCGKLWGNLVDLIGGRKADLCTNCLVVWHYHVRGEQAWTDNTRLVATQNMLAGRALAGDAPSADEWLEYHTANDANRDALFDIADAWLREARDAKGEANDEK